MIRLTAYLFNIRINVFNERSLTNPILVSNPDLGWDHEHYTDSLNLFFSGPSGGGHFDFINYGITNLLLS